MQITKTVILSQVLINFLCAHRRPIGFFFVQRGKFESLKSFPEALEFII